MYKRQIPDSVKSLGSSAFSSCTALKSVTLPKSLSSIGDNTFDSCTSLEQITLPEAVREIGMDAFMGCSSLKSLNIPNGVECLKGRIVCLCTSLERISLPASLKIIESEAFLDCSGLKDVYFGGTRAQWNAISIGSDNDILESASIHFTGEYPFTDVKVDGAHKPYADAIKWASDNGVTTGYGDGIFKPDQSCTRAQVVTFLWRAAGKPAPKSTNNPFADVSAKQANGSDNPYYTAILWAVENGITLGYDSTHFAPDKSVTRAQFVTFLWRYENKPEAKDGMTIKDIDSVTVADFRAAILWAAGEGITTGYADGSFRPDNTCTRAHVVTFIYRDIA